MRSVLQPTSKTLCDRCGCPIFILQYLLHNKCAIVSNYTTVKGVTRNESFKPSPGAQSHKCPGSVPATWRCCSAVSTACILCISIIIWRCDSRNWSLAIVHVRFNSQCSRFSCSRRRHTACEQDESTSLLFLSHSNTS